MTRIRDATPADLDAIVAIYNETIPARSSTADLEPVVPASREGWLAAHDPARRPLWVLVGDDGTVRAWLSLKDWSERRAYSVSAEVSIYVAGAARRSGHGRELLALAIERAPALGLDRLLAVVFAHNAPSVALFERFAFEPWGRLPGVAVLDDRRADVLILGRVIEPPGETLR